MQIVKMLIEEAQLDENRVRTWNVIVMVEGAVHDVAVYRSRMLHGAVWGTANTCLAENVAYNGTKLTEAEALEVFAIPDGAHYVH